jgi:hypothetical protein
VVASGGLGSECSGSWWKAFALKAGLLIDSA